MSSNIVEYFANKENGFLDTQDITIHSITLLVSVIGAFASAIILISTAKKSGMSPHMLLIVTLMITDFLATSIGSIFFAVVIGFGGWRTPLVDSVSFCTRNTAVTVLMIEVEAFSCALIAAERYLLIICGWKNHENHTKLAILANWCMALVFQPLYLISLKNIEISTSLISCLPNFTGKSAFLLFMNGVIIVILSMFISDIAYCYHSIFKHICILLLTTNDQRCARNYNFPIGIILVLDG
jgi:hypothetical protein